MTTPYLYGKDHFDKILDQYPGLSIFHQTSINNLASILSCKAVYSTGTLWGMEDSKRRTSAKSQNQVQAWKVTSENGFIDYVFTSSINYLALGKNTFGTVTLELKKDVLRERENFIFPRATRFDFDKFLQHEKSSDATMWTVILGDLDHYSTHEILVRRKLDLGYLVRIHHYDNLGSRVRDELVKFRLEHVLTESHKNPKRLSKADMKAVINGMTLDAYFVDASKSKVDLYSNLDADYAEYYGEYEVDKDQNILEKVALTSGKIVIGKLIIDALNVSPISVPNAG